MTQTQLDLNNHFGFQLSLLRLSVIPGPSSKPGAESVRQEAEKLEALAERAILTGRQ